MINAIAILFALIVVLSLYTLIRYFGIWLGCMTSLVYLMAIIFVPILIFLVVTAAFAELLEIFINTFV